MTIRFIRVLFYSNSQFKRYHRRPWLDLILVLFKNLLYFILSEILSVCATIWKNLIIVKSKSFVGSKCPSSTVCINVL